MKFEERIKEMAKLYDSGMSINKIARIFGYNPATVSKYLKQYGVSTRRWRSVDINKVLELYEKGLRLWEIARELGVSVYIIQNNLRQAGIRLRPGPHPRRPLVTCPKCGRPGRLGVRTDYKQQYVYVWHSDGKYCHIAPMDKISQYPQLAEALKQG
ncbi:MAG: helix-turn-helix domain-containing protein [Pyrobaculum sp.]